jgi:hypothetical protein
MSRESALVSKMRRLLASVRSMPPLLDPDTADRLLAGRLDPADAPPGYGPVARLLAAATASPSPDELAGEQRVRAQFVAMADAHPLGPSGSRTNTLRRLSRVKAAVVIAVALLSIGGIAVVTTGGLPGPAAGVAGRAAPSSGSLAVRPPMGVGAGPATSAEVTTPRLTTPPTRAAPPQPSPGLRMALADLTEVVGAGQRQGMVDSDGKELVDVARVVVRDVQAGDDQAVRTELETLEHVTEAFIAGGRIRGVFVGRIRQQVAQFSTAAVGQHDQVGGNGEDIDEQGDAPAQQNREGARDDAEDDQVEGGQADEVADDQGED